MFQINGMQTSTLSSLTIARKSCISHHCFTQGFRMLFPSVVNQFLTVTVSPFACHDLHCCFSSASCSSVLDSLISPAEILPNHRHHSFEYRGHFFLSVTVQVNVIGIGSHGLVDEFDPGGFGEFPDESRRGSITLLSQMLLSNSHKFLALFGVLDVATSHMKDLPQVVQMFDFTPQLIKRPPLKFAIDLFNTFSPEPRQEVPLRRFFRDNSFRRVCLH